MRGMTAVELNRVADRAWEKYDKKFDNEARKKWRASFEERLKAFDAEFIAPLALNHVAWMKSAILTDHLECNYDPRHAGSGVVYTSAITQCIAATQDKRACAELYDEWLKGDITDTKNIALRAMILNQDITAKAIEEATTVSLDLRQIPWDNIFAASGIAMSSLSRQAQDVTAHLIAQFGGPIARMFNKVIDSSPRFRAAIMATGLISGHPVVICDIVGSKKNSLRC